MFMFLFFAPFGPLRNVHYKCVQLCGENHFMGMEEIFQQSFESIKPTGTKSDNTVNYNLTQQFENSNENE